MDLKLLGQSVLIVVLGAASFVFLLTIGVIAVEGIIDMDKGTRYGCTAIALLFILAVGLVYQALGG